MILKKIIYAFIAISLAVQSPAFAYEKISHSKNSPLSIQHIRKTYVNAKINYLTPTELNNLKGKLAQNEFTKPINSNLPIINDQCLEYKIMFHSAGRRYDTPSSSTPGVDPYPKNQLKPQLNLNGTFSSGDNKGFLVFVAVVGVVVVAALVVYAGSYIYYSLKSNTQCQAWTEWGWRYSVVNDNSETQVRRGILNGIYFSKGYYFPRGVMALTAEFGNFQMDLKINELNSIKNFNGPYLMIGPTFTFPITSLNRQNFSIELLGGTTTEKEIGFMSTLRMGLGFHVTDQFSFSIGLGAAFIKIKGVEGFLGHSDDLNFISGLKSTVKF